MKYLIDTHILLWYISGNNKLDKKAIAIIDNPDNHIYIGNVSLWEITIKSSLKKLELKVPILEMKMFLEEEDFQWYSYNYQHLNTLITLPFHYGAPFDRLIIAQAITDDLIVVTNDNQFKKYNVKLYN